MGACKEWHGVSSLCCVIVACMEFSIQKKLSENIVGAFGVDGEVWLSSLGEIVKSLQDEWKLRNLECVGNMTYHYVAKAFDDKDVPVVLKVGCSDQLIQNEASFLNHISGAGAVRLLQKHQKYRALLLQQAIPGTTLKVLYPKQSQYVMDHYLDVVTKLHSGSKTPVWTVKHIADWLKALDLADPDKFPKGMLEQAVSLRDEMLSTAQTLKLLHGDLHLDNILMNGDEWLAIDPQGVLGEPEFEVAAFDFIDNGELGKAKSPDFTARIEQLANKADLSFDRIRNWTYIRLVLSAAWSLEDNGDPSRAIALAQLMELS